jgi:manganese/iron transport system permease protein
MTARLLTHRVRTAMIAAPAFGAASGAIGLTASAEWDISAGSAIVLTSAALFLVTWTVTAAAQHLARRRAVTLAL